MQVYGLHWIGFYFPTEHFKVRKISLKRVRGLQIELQFESVSFYGERKPGVHGEKPLGAKERTNSKLNPHMASTLGFETRPNQCEASALTAASPLLS